MEFMLDNADGAGQSLTQVAKLAADELMETGRFGLLADYPMVDGELTVEQVRRMALQPHIATYTAESDDQLARSRSKRTPPARNAGTLKEKLASSL